MNNSIIFLLNQVKTYFSVNEEYTFSTGSELTFFKVTKILTNLSDWSHAEKSKTLKLREHLSFQVHARVVHRKWCLPDFKTTHRT